VTTIKIAALLYIFGGLVTFSILMIIAQKKGELTDKEKELQKAIENMESETGQIWVIAWFFVSMLLWIPIVIYAKTEGRK
jgi:uncharacterized membrane protein